MDDITRNVYKENAQLVESFKLNTEEIERLKKLNNQFQSQYELIKAQNDENSVLAKERVEIVSKQSKKIKDLNLKIEILEKSVSQIVQEFEHERSSLIKRHRFELENSSSELEKLRKTLELKSKEMNKVKKLAKNILEQRSEIERFFLDSLDFVKRQIIYNRNEYRKEASQMYNQKMIAAHLGQIEFPKIRTFSKNAHSTNNVFKDLEQAEKWYFFP